MYVIRFFVSEFVKSRNDLFMSNGRLEILETRVFVYDHDHDVYLRSIGLEA